MLQSFSLKSKILALMTDKNKKTKEKDCITKSDPNTYVDHSRGEKFYF